MSQPHFKQDDFQPVNTKDTEVDSFDETPRTKMPKALKYLAGTAVGLAVLAGAGGLIATQLIDQQKYKGMIVSKVEESTGYKIDWEGNINLGLMPLPHASVQKLTVTSGGTQILSINHADIQVALAPLFSKKIEIKNITLDEPVVTLITTKSGQRTWETKSQNKAEPQSNASIQNESEASASPLDLSVDRIDITGGNLILDNQKSGSKQELKNLNITLRAESLKGPFDIKASTEWSGQMIEVKATSGEVNIAEGSYPIQTQVSVPNSGINLTFAGIVDSKNLGASGDINLEVVDFAKAVQGISDTSLSFPDGLGGKAMLAGKIVSTANRFSIDDLAFSVGDIAYTGKIAADGLAGNTVPQLSFKLDSKSKVSGNASDIVRLLSDLKIDAKASIENDKVQIAYANFMTLENNVSLKGFASLGSKPAVDLTIAASEINLDALGKSQKSSGSEKGQAPLMSGNNTPKEFGFDLPFSGRIRADIGKLTTQAKIYSNIKADIVSSGNALNISNSEITLPENATIAVSGKIGNTKSLSDLNLKLMAKTSDADSLMASYDVKTPELPQKIGAVNINGNFTGDLKNLSFSSTVTALQFNVTGQGSVTNILGAPDINSLKFTIRHPNFNEAMRTFQKGFDGSSGFFGPLDVSGQVKWGGDKVEVTALDGKLGQTSINGNISAITKPKTKISGALDFGNIILPSATNNGGTIEAAEKSVSATSEGGDRWSRDVIDTSWMHSFDADLDIKAKSITQNMWRLSDANFDFILNDGVLTLNDVSAGLFGGRAVLSGIIKSGAGKTDPVSVSAKLNANDVDAKGLMSAVTGKPSYTMTGTLSTVDVNVNATGASSVALVQTLGGDGNVQGKNIVVKGVDAAQLASAAKGSYKPLERAGSLFQSFQNGQTEFTDFNASFVIQSGIVNFSKINFDGPKALLNSTGIVNLPKWTIDLKNSMTVKDTDIPPFDFTVRGSLDNPMNSGGDIVNNYLQKKFEKKATQFIEDKLGGKLDKLLGVPQTPVTEPVEGEVAPTQQPNVKEEAAKEAVKALQGLFGK